MFQNDCIAVEVNENFRVKLHENSHKRHFCKVFKVLKVKFSFFEFLQFSTVTCFPMRLFKAKKNLDLTGILKEVF